MAIDAVLKLHKRIGRQEAEVGLLTADGTQTPLTLKYRKDARQDKGRFEESLQKAEGGFLLADQLTIDGPHAYPKYLTVLKRAHESNKRVFTAPITTAHVFQKGEYGSYQRITTPWDLIQASNSRQKITIIATIAKSNPVHVDSLDSAFRELYELRKSFKTDSYTPKLICSPLDSSPSFDLFAERDMQGNIDMETSRRRVMENEVLADSLSTCGGIKVFKGGALRLSELSVASILKHWMNVRPGAKYTALERFFSQTVDGMQNLYSHGLVVSSISTGSRGAYEYGTNYRVLSDAKPIKAF